MKSPTFSSRLFLFLTLWFLLFSGYGVFFIFQKSIDPAIQWQMVFSTLLNQLLLLVVVRGIFWIIQFFGEAFTRICAVVLFGVSVPLLVIDFLIFQQFKFHINSFVLKVMLQPNAFETLGLRWTAGVTFLVVLGFGLLVSMAIWWLAGMRQVGFLRRWFTGRWRQLGLCLLIFVATLADKTAFAWQLHQGNYEFYLTAKRIPFYIVVEMGKTFASFGPSPPPENFVQTPALSAFALSSQAV